MTGQSILCHHPPQMNNLKRNRTSILRPGELVEIQGSYWPRLRRKKTSNKKIGNTKSSLASPSKSSRKIKNKMEFIRQLKKIAPMTSSDVVLSPNPLSSISSFNQNTGPCWKPRVEDFSSIKTSPFTGRPIHPRADNITKSIGQSSTGLRGPRRKKTLKPVVSPRWRRLGRSEHQEHHFTRTRERWISTIRSIYIFHSCLIPVLCIPSMGPRSCRSTNPKRPAIPLSWFCEGSQTHCYILDKLLDKNFVNKHFTLDIS